MNDEVLNEIHLTFQEFPSWKLNLTLLHRFFCFHLRRKFTGKLVQRFPFSDELDVTPINLIWFITIKGIDSAMWFKSDSGKSTAIKDLKEAFKSIKQLQNSSDETTFELLFEVSRQFCKLNISLNREFPNTKPGMFVVVLRIQL